jgi:hypothetical protein
VTALAPAADYASAQRMSAGVARERYVRGSSAADERIVPLSPTHVRVVPSARLRLYGGATTLLRLLARGIYLFPVLLVAKVALLVADSWYGDLITVAFVVLVVAFFAVLAATLLLHLLVGPRSERAARTTFRLDLPEVGDHERILGMSAHPKRYRGLVQAGLAPGQPVISDQWLERDGMVWRLFEGRCFAVVAEGETPVVVDLAACPVLLGPYVDTRAEPSAAALVLARSLADLGEASGARCELRQGDLVEVLAADAQPLDRLEDERLAAVLSTTGERGPYRAGGDAGAIVVRSTLEQPAVLRRIDAATS